MMQIAQVIKYEGDNSTLVWKHPVEDFNSMTQLIVHESQEALFVMNGQVLDLFVAGRYTLETQNIPLISKHFNRTTGNDTPFHCEVYFINKTELMAIKWGTDSKIEYLEPTYKFPLKIGASGEMNIRIEDSRRLLVKVVGTEKEMNQAMFVKKFRAFLMMKFKTYLSNLIQKNGITIFEMDEHLIEISETMHEKLKAHFQNYGVSLEHFFVTTIVKPEQDKDYLKFKELHFRQYAEIAEAKILQQVGIIEQQTQAKKTVIEAEALSQKRQLEGYTYQSERGYDVAEKVADNEAVGQMSNLGVGLGMMAGVGGAVGGTVGGMVSNVMGEVANPNTAAVNSPTGAQCPKCAKVLPANAKFCLECGCPIINKCSNCGTEVPPNGKFCLECGTKLGS